MFLAVIRRIRAAIADNVCAGRSDIISTVTRYSGQQLAVTLALKADDYFYGSGILGTISFAHKQGVDEPAPLCAAAPSTEAYDTDIRHLIAREELPMRARENASAKAWLLPFVLLASGTLYDRASKPAADIAALN